MKRRNHCVKRNYMVCIFTQHEVELTIFSSKYFPSLTSLLPTHIWKVWGHLDPSFLIFHIQSSSPVSSLLSISPVCPHPSCNWSPYLALLLLKSILSTTIDKGCSSPALVSLRFPQKAQMVPQWVRTPSSHSPVFKASLLRSGPWFICCSCSSWLIPAFCSHTVPCQMVILKHSLPLSTSKQFLRKFSVSFFPHPHQGKPTKASRVQFKYCPLHGAFSKASSTLLRTDKRWLQITKRQSIMSNSLLYFQSCLPQYFTFNRCSRTLKWNNENMRLYMYHL